LICGAARNSYWPASAGDASAEAEIAANPNVQAFVAIADLRESPEVKLAPGAFINR
jgi:hypothetical protein